MAVEPEVGGVHAPAVDAMTVEVIDEIEGPVIAEVWWLMGPWAVGITAGVGYSVPGCETDAADGPPDWP